MPKSYVDDEMTISSVAAAVGVSVDSLRKWYAWAIQQEMLEIPYPKDMPELPMPRLQMQGKVMYRYWKPEDIRKLKKFAKWVPKGRKGVMGR